MIRHVFFFRHGEADWPDWEGEDDERPLTKKGKAEVKRVARFLKRVGAEPLLVFTSPLPRAAETAKMIAKQLCLELGIENSLGKGFNAEKFRRIVAAHDVASMVLVGHEPAFSEVIGALTGADVVLRKSGVALVATDKPFAKGKLLWLFPPRFAKRA